MPHVYIMRHGHAGPAGPNLPDSARTLTSKGFAEIRQIAVRLGERAPDIDRIFFSPYVRTRQTAALVNNELNASLDVLDQLVPDGDPEHIIDHIAGIEDAILLVSHMPLVNDLAFRLTGQKIVFHQGTCIKVFRDDPFDREGTLAWTLDP